MSRQDFISDNLYSMRERFKQNYEQKKAHPSPAVENPSPAEETYTEAEKSIDSSAEKITETVAVVPETAAAAEIPETNDAELRREKNELEAMLLRDSAFVQRRLQELSAREKDVRGFGESLQEILEKLNRSGKLTLRDVENLRKRYFQEYGRFDAIESQRSGKTLLAQGCEPSISSGYRPGYWALVTAVILGALAVAGTMVLLFG